MRKLERAEVGDIVRVRGFTAARLAINGGLVLGPGPRTWTTGDRAWTVLSHDGRYWTLKRAR